MTWDTCPLIQHLVFLFWSSVEIFGYEFIYDWWLPHTKKRIASASNKPSYKFKYDWFLSEEFIKK